MESESSYELLETTGEEQNKIHPGEKGDAESETDRPSKVRAEPEMHHRNNSAPLLGGGEEYLPNPDADQYPI